MKVLVFTTLYPNNIWPNLGVFVKERMTNFARLEGCTVKVVAPVPYFPPIKIGNRWKFSQVLRQDRIEGIEVFHPRYLMTPKIGMTTYGFLMFLSVLPTVKRIKQDFDFDIIDAHYIYPDCFAAILLGQVFQKPVVVSARGSDIHLFARFPLIRRLLQHTLHRSAKVIAVCQALKEAMTDLNVPAHKISVIPNGVDPAKFYPISKPESRKALGLPDKRIILSVGAVTSNKGFHLLIKAVKILRDEFHVRDLNLVIVGEGSFRKELEALVASSSLEEQVRLVGARPHHELQLWYSAADLFCLASNGEGWPNVILESLACGTPVIATNVWGIPEIIVSDRLGILTERNEREIAESIFSALAKPWQPDALVEYAHGKTWDKVALGVFHAFSSVLNGKA